MLGNKKKYDLIFSIGEACSCSSTLCRAGLQIASYPFDWLFGSDFIGRIEILCNKFKRFIDKDDLTFAYSERSILNCIPIKKVRRQLRKKYHV